VHIWQARLDQADPGRVDYFSLLSEDEKERAARFFFERDRHRYIVGRATLRLLLAGYMDAQPAEIQFGYSPLGKPFIKTKSHRSELQFNLAHSHDRAVYSFSTGGRVGIDIEEIHSMPGMGRFAEFYYSPRECLLFNSLEGHDKLRTFFKIWTCKEAVFKAIGAGLTKDISQTEVSFNSSQQPELVCIDGDRRQAHGWHLELFAPFDGYQAALAVENLASNLIIRTVDDISGLS